MSIRDMLCRTESMPIFALFSGGNHSHVSTHYAMNNGAHEVVHIKTGIGIPATTEHATECCKSQGWPLRIIEPPDKSFRDFVLKYGFPGPAAHRYSYVWLKERALKKLARETVGRLGRVAFVTGVHSSESARRMGYVQDVVRTGSMVWLAPFFQSSEILFSNYMQEWGLKCNPVSPILGFSGECLCGAFAQPNEIAKLERHFPETAAHIHALEAEVKAAGKHCVWGVRPPRSKPLNEDQLTFMPLCAACPAR